MLYYFDIYTISIFYMSKSVLKVKHFKTIQSSLINYMFSNTLIEGFEYT